MLVKCLVNRGVVWCGMIVRCIGMLIFLDRLIRWFRVVVFVVVLLLCY